MNNIKTLLKIFPIVSILILGSCELFEEYFKDQLPTSIDLNKNEITLDIGQKEKVTATVKPENVIDKSVIWESSNSAIATVTSTGEIIGITEGSAVISVKTVVKKDITNTVHVTIKKPIVNPNSVTISNTITSLSVGETFQLQKTILPTDTSDKSVSWISSNPDIVSVSTEGLLTAKAAGNTTITVTSIADNNIKDTISIEIMATVVNPESITISNTITSLSVGETYQLQETILPTNTSDKSVSWISSNPEIVSVSTEGLLTGKAAGDATITVTSIADNNISNTMSIKIMTSGTTIIKPESITISNTIASLSVGETYQLQETILPTNTSDKSVSWISSNPEIVSVSTKGLLTGKAEGNASITVTSIADNNISNTMSIKIMTSGTTIIKPESITISNAVATLSIGETLQLQTTIIPTNTTNNSVSWASSNTNVATIDQLGNLSIKNLGDTTITATISGTNISNSFNLKGHHSIFSYSKQEEFSLFDEEYRPISNTEKNPTLPSVGDVTYVDFNTESLAISENNPDINTFNNPFTPFNTFIKLVMNKISNSNRDTLNNTPFSFTLSELPDTDFNNCIIKNNTIYGVLNTKMDNDGNLAKLLLIMRVNSNNILETYVKFGMFNSNYSQYASSIGEILTHTDFINKNVSSISKSLGLIDPNNSTYEERYSKSTVITDGNNKLSAFYNEEDKDQDFTVENSYGKTDIRIYESENNSNAVTHIHTDFYNSKNELIAIVSYNADTLDISKLDSNDLGAIVSNIDLQYSLKNILPLKQEYSKNYDLISIVTSSASTISKSYYLYSKTFAGVARQPIPTYNGEDIIQYINSFIDRAEDINVNSYIEDVYDYPNISFTWTTDTNYFSGPALSTVEASRVNFKSMYDKHWIGFRNSTVDYSKIVRTQEELDILNSISN